MTQQLQEWDASVLVYALARQSPGGGGVILGTAFAAGGRHVVTAYHVVGSSDEGLVLLIPRIANLNTYQDADQIPAIPMKIVAADPVRDLCVLEFPEQNFATTSYAITGSDSVGVGEPIVTLGFPHAPSGRYVLTHQRAHIGARLLLGSSAGRHKHFVLNTQARPGQSGSPVFNDDLTEVVGVLLGSFAPGGGGAISLGGVDPATLHQTTHAISAEYIREML